MVANTIDEADYGDLLAVHNGPQVPWFALLLISSIVPHGLLSKSQHYLLRVLRSRLWRRQNALKNIRSRISYDVFAK